MEIRNRLFPYPVLSEDSDDYREGTFIVTPSVAATTDSDICLEFNIELNEPKLKTLINEDKAEFVIHIECSSTCFRTVAYSQSSIVRYKLPKNLVNKKVQLLGMLIAKEKITNFASIALNRDYDDVDIVFEKGAILAYHNMAPLDINKTYEELTGSDSIFRVCRFKKNDMERNPITFALTDERIKITVDDDVYDIFAPMKDRKSMEYIIKTSLLLPALIYMLERLRYEPGTLDDYQGSAWFMQIDKHYNALGKSFVDKIDSNESITTIAQELLDKPVNDLYLNLKAMLEE